MSFRRYRLVNFQRTEVSQQIYWMETTVVDGKQMQTKIEVFRAGLYFLKKNE